MAVRRPVASILSFDLGIPSNNHLLNSLLTKLSALISETPFALRLPNVLARVDRSGVDGAFDYYFYLPEDEQTLASHPITIVHKFKTSGATLAKRSPDYGVSAKQ